MPTRPKNKIQIRINEKYKNTNKKNKYSQFNLKLVATSKIRDFSILLLTRILFDNIQRILSVCIIFSKNIAIKKVRSTYDFLGDFTKSDFLKLNSNQ